LCYPFAAILILKNSEIFNDIHINNDILDKFGKKKMPKRAIIFDFDLTLADATKGIYLCMNYALEHFGYPVQKEDIIKKTIGYSIPESFKLLTGNPDPQIADEFTKVFVTKADQVMNLNTFVFPEVYKILPEIKSMGFETAIVSTKYRYRIAGILEREKLDKYIDYIVGGEDVKAHKPNPEGLIIALDKMGVLKSDAIYVGDSVVDAEASQNAEIQFFAVLTGTSVMADFEQYKTSFVLKNLSELIEILHSID
jgi:phosphoglycolate phosphatase